MITLESNDAHRTIANILNALASLDIESTRAVLAHVGEITEAIHGGYFLCPESEAIGMRASVKNIKPSRGLAAFKRIAKQNSKSMARMHLAAGQLFVHVGNDSIPTKRLKKGMPRRGRNKTHVSPIKPNRNNSSR